MSRDLVDLDDYEVGEEFYAGGCKWVKFNETQAAIILDDKGDPVEKPKEH
jgi:hypothetical protein